VSFVQLIEVCTDDYDGLERLHEQWLEATGGQRTATREWICRDRDRADTYVIVVEFPSLEAAEANNELPATAEIARSISAMSSTPPAFRNLDLLRQD
jgi:quinol monooxygenase YgiN